MASFDKYIPLLAQVEGGYQNMANDPGNFNSLGQNVGTNFGISARFYETIIKRPPAVSDMYAITASLAKGLFKNHFWNVCKADQIKDQAMANTIVDHHVNAGSGVKLAQKVLNDHFGYKMAEDNGMGPITLAALNAVKPSAFVSRYNEARADYYRSIGNATFINGWLTRLKSFAYSNPGIAISTGAVILIGVFFFAMYKLNK